MKIELKYDDLIIKYLILSLPILLISGPLLPEIAVGIIFFLIINKIIKNKIKFFDKIFTYLFLFFCFNLVVGSIFSVVTFDIDLAQGKDRRERRKRKKRPY